MKVVDLWVCPSCHVLLGIDIDFESNAFCVSCGIKLKIDNISFLNLELVNLLQTEIKKLLSEEYHEYSRFRWLSNKTASIMVDFDEGEVIENHPELYTEIEDGLAELTDLFITLIFE